jgi:hypothetical protein
MSAATLGELTARIEQLEGRIERLEASTHQLEAQVAIRAVMTDYMCLCDRLDDRTPMLELGELFTVDAVWTGKGSRYGAAFGSHHGRDAIVAMLGAYREPPHFTFNAHYLTSEKIQVSADTARGEWLMLQTSTYSTGASDLRSARLTVDFLRRAPSVPHSAVLWQISRFETENLFSRPVDRWDDPTPVLVPRPLPADNASTAGGA